MRRLLLAVGFLLLVPAPPTRVVAAPITPPSIHLPVSFNGHVVPRCLVDSGATASLLDAETVKQVPNVHQSGVSLEVALGGSRQQATWVWVDSVQTADLQFGAAWVVIMPTPAPLCLLGGDLLARQGAVVLDFAQQRVRPWARPPEPS